ncbi:hypothetical protein ACHQM5_002520 [Ranunculus cassubicifolius]
MEIHLIAGNASVEEMMVALEDVLWIWSLQVVDMAVAGGEGGSGGVVLVGERGRWGDAVVPKVEVEISVTISYTSRYVSAISN